MIYGTDPKQTIKAALKKKDGVKFKGTPETEFPRAEDEFSLAETSVLVKKPDCDFVIMNIADIHLSDGGYRFFTNFDALHKVKKLVRLRKPDLITVSGDFICGDRTEYSIRRFTDFLDDLGVPFAPVFGNHDDEGNCDLDYAFETMLKSPLCMGKKGDPRMGVGNYIVCICEEKGSKRVPIFSLFMTDSHHGDIRPEQIKWYERAVNGMHRIAPGSKSAVIFHVPLPEYGTMLSEDYDSEKHLWKSGSDGFGETHESVCAQKPGDFFAKVKELGHTTDILCSHDHLNDFSALYEGIRLTYMLKVGMASGAKHRMNGMTMIKVGNGGISSIEHIERKNNILKY